jgi:hypothetical protein
LFYRYKSINTDAEGVRDALGTHFTCFKGTKVQILTQKALAGALGIQFTCFTGRKVQILTQKALAAREQGKSFQARMTTQCETKIAAGEFVNGLS